jgi:glycosyltransferase involved in cell wall biosynthesis
MTDPPIVGIAGRLISLLRRKPFLYYIQDLHPDMAMASGLVGTGFLVRIWENLHRWALRGASLVAVLGEDMRERVIAKGVDPRSVEVVPHGAPKQDNLASPDHPVTQEIRCGFPFVVLHAGNLGFYGAWGSLIEAARILDEEEVGFIFVGDGAAKPLIETLASSCHNVRFLPFRPAGEVCYVLAAADIHVITIRKGLDGMVVPSKLYPILRAGRPVLAVTPEGSHVSRIVARSGCGIVADPEDPSSVAASIRDVLRDRSYREQMGQCARAVAREYDRGEQLKHFVQLIKKTIGS